MREGEFLNCNEDYLFSKLHAIMARSLCQERLENVVQRCHSLGDLELVLQPMGISFAEHRKVQKMIYHSLFVQILYIMKGLPEGLKEYYQLTLGRFFCDNIKAVFHRQYVPETEENEPISDLLFNVPSYPTISVSPEGRLILDKKGRLPEGWRQEIEKIAKLTLQEASLFQIENRLDRMYWQSLLTCCQKMPKSLRSILLSYFSQVVDFRNLMTLFRNLRYYHLTAEELEMLLLPNEGLLNLPTLLHLVKITKEEELKQQLPKKYQDLIGNKQKSLADVEQNFQNSLYQEVWQLFRNFEQPILSVVAFPLIKVVEMQNISRLYESMRLGISGDILRRFLVGLKK